MAYTAWCKWLEVRFRRKLAERKSTYRLRLEELEERRCPAITLGLNNPTVEDTGPSHSDNYTSYTTPDLVGQALPNDIVGVFQSDDGMNVTLLGTVNCDGSGNWSYSITTPLPAGEHQLTMIEGLGGLANQFPDVIVDTVENPPTNLTLDPSSDTGTPGDNTTSITTPTITGNADKALVDATASNFKTTVTLYDSDGVTVLGSGTINRDTGAWSIAITTPLSIGTHDITAKATDLAGNVSSASTALALTIVPAAPAAPTGLALDPSTDSGIVGDNLTNFNKPKITGKAEVGSTVQLFDGTTPLNPTAQADSGGNWAITLSAALTDGAHSLTAKATNGGGTGPASTALSLQIDTTPPAAPTNVALDSSTDSGNNGDNLTNFSKPKIDGKAEAGSTVQLFDGNTALTPTALADGGGNWSITLAAALGDGLHNLTAKATDVAGNTGNASAVLPLTIDTTAPAPPASLTLDPSTDSGLVGDGITNFNKPTITGTAEAGSTVSLKEGTAVLGTAVATGGTWSISLVGSLADGVHSLTATAADGAGNTSLPSSTLTLTIKTSVLPPAGLALSPPTTSNIINVPTPTIVGTAEANSTVRVLDGGTLLGNTTANASGAWSFMTPPRADGVHAFTAVAVDVAGNTSSASAPLTVTVQTSSPVVPPPVQPPPGITRLSVQLAKVKKGKRVKQLVTVTNTGTVAVSGSLQFILVGLSKKLKVMGGGKSPSGSPMVLLNLGTPLMPGSTWTFTLRLVNPRLQKVSYTPKVLSDVGVLLT
jgi:hypothetical protein